MNDNAKKWVEALRSWRYTQTLSHLTVNEGDTTSHCCLGVACELAIEAGVPIYRDTQRDQGLTHYVSPDGRRSSSLLPLEVQDWLGLKCDAGDYYADDQLEGESPSLALTSDNDGGKSFEQIADIIESEPKGLFLTTAES